ncbi:putative methyltransferase [Wigglesworthia glossinidia endosymbiont of Glossina morsitans morsitans (Yale colony)]|uniref:Ribosomal RNA small subunit methyltransferase I n=1 Tax=Wigglesworthia glossinidia endosymbiont of Glossina morsitans morsitans (Yale colony) TaxID=1142511 RepID=H6Q5V1_WIGGL|nr:16S rRNA (cytidine(1402)-2'-O)-methyltransferase [Wigglesworthia glossinidia]AFA41147.1 putative methyltransferase [Wigglesworthia glossinidia endosymbiont of Glossina morsitans morsitans (Yale colony)]
MQKNKKLPSTLYIVPTPIGNLKDITYRAVSVLKYVDIIAAESVLYAKILLKHFLIKNHLISFNKINEKIKTKLIIRYLKNRKSIALISNAGTPTISDPGYYLIYMCIKHKINIVPLPGPCSLITALSASGVATNKFCYDGFLPKKKSERIAYLNSLKFEHRTIILFESSRRLLISLQDIAHILGMQTHIVIAKELTKIWETIYRNTVEKILNLLKNSNILLKGEIILIIKQNQIESKIISKKAIKLLKLLTMQISKKQATLIVSKTFKIKKNLLYKYIIQNIHN